MPTASEIFENLESTGDEALDLLREEAFTPNSTKNLRSWGITEVAEMVGRTTQSIIGKEKLGAFPPASKAKKGRAYDLEEINLMRDHFGTRPRRSDDDETAILAFANFKGGAAKTTTAVHSAMYFAKAGYRTLFIDCDSQASATQIFGYNPDQHIENTKTLLPCLTDNLPISKVIRKTYWPGLNLVPANLGLYGAEFQLPVLKSKALDRNIPYDVHAILLNALDEVKEDYDIIILDCPPSMGMISINAIYASNAFIIPLPPSMLDFASTIQFFAIVNEILKDLPPKEYSFIRLLVTKHDGQDSNNTLVDTLRALYGQFMMRNMMFTSEAIRKASSDLLTLYEIEKYAGSKATFDRAIQFTNKVNQEIESLIHQMWPNTNFSKKTKQRSTKAKEGIRGIAPWKKSLKQP